MPSRTGTEPAALAGLHVGHAVCIFTGWAGVMVRADASAVVLDPDQARLLAASLNLAAEDADTANDKHIDPEGQQP
jgi:hypothetical protein